MTTNATKMKMENIKIKTDSIKKNIYICMFIKVKLYDHLFNKLYNLTATIQCL